MGNKVFYFIIFSIVAFVVGSFLHAQAAVAVANLESCIDRQISAASSSTAGQVPCNNTGNQPVAWTPAKAEPATMLTSAR